ncbi:MAG: putative metal-binding motif-containing protein [Myxococcota bacterium]
MLLPIPLATAADMTWTCPTLASPGDGQVFEDVYDLGTLVLLDEVTAIAEASYDAACPSGDDYTSDGDDTIWTEDCVTASGVHIVGTLAYTTERLWDDQWLTTWSTDLTLTPEPSAGYAWTSLILTSEVGSTCCDEDEDAAAWEATWTGEIDPRWPSDASVRGSAQYDWTDWRQETWDDGSCAWSAESYYATWDISVGEQRLELGWDDCGYLEVATADLDGATSFVTYADWSVTVPDADADGHPAGDCDCDDGDATAHADGVEPCAYDEIDQDCDGSNLVDDDGDGHGDDDCGGDDCADWDEGSYPTAEEVPYDGVDQDCSGGDLVDVDGDGHAAEEARGHDCNDGDPAVHPDADELAGDGVDQDCDGLDPATPAQDVVGTGSSSDGSEPAPPAEEPNEEPRGCGQGAWVLVALLARRPLSPPKRGEGPP